MKIHKFNTIVLGVNTQRCKLHYYGGGGGKWHLKTNIAPVLAANH